MSSEVRANKISPATGTALQISDSGDTTTIPSGATLDVSSATMTGFTIPSGQTLTVASGATIDASAGTATGFGGGITEADMWRITADQTNPAGDITANWEQADTDGFAVLGSGLSESSGIFTFPSTGYWSITLSGMWSNTSADERYVGLYLYTTLNNADYDGASYGLGSLGGGTSTRNGNTPSNFIFDVTSTTNCKFKVVGYCSLATTILQGDSDRCETCVTVIRLGDT